MRKKYKIVCINNKPIEGHSDKIQNLTIGDIYETYDNPDYDVCVINDLGNEVNYHSGRFIPLDVWRERKLNKLLEK